MFLISLSVYPLCDLLRGGVVRRSRFGVAVVVMSLVASLTVGLPPLALPAVAAGPSSGDVPVATSALPRTDQPVALPAAAPVPAAPVWPSAGTATAQLSDGSLMTSALSGDSMVSDQVVPGGLPVTVAAGSTLTVEQVEQRLLRGLDVPAAASTSISSVDISVLDQAATAGLALKGVAFTVSTA
jgi:hypothetical protein